MFHLIFGFSVCWLLTEQLIDILCICWFVIKVGGVSGHEERSFTGILALFLHVNEDIS